MLKNLFLVLAFVIASPALAAEPPQISEFTLDNGMEVIVVSDHRVPAVSHNLLFRVGAADDPRGKSGLAHYLEHMLFQGTEKYKPNEYSRIIARHGGKTNAFTTADYTGYWVNIARDHLPLVMELEADRLQHLNPPQPDFDKEKQVILEERRSRVENNPEALFAEQFNAVLYYNYPYGTPIIGWASEMANLNRDDVMEYLRRFYHANNAVLVLSGDITPDQARELAQQYYGPLSGKGETVPPRVQEPPHLASRELTMRHPQVGQPSWSRSFLTPSYGTHAEGEENILMPLMLAEQILGGSKTSRLYRRLVEEEDLARDVSVYYNPFQQGPGEFSINVTAASEEAIPQIERIVEEEVAKLSQNLPGADEVERAKTLSIASNIYLRDGLQSLARVMGHLRMIGLPLDFYRNWEERIKAITPEQVRDSLKVLDERRMVTGVLLPEVAEAGEAQAKKEPKGS